MAEDVSTVTLDSLVGEHILDGVDLSSERVRMYDDKYEDASVIRFRLDGIVFTAIEDPSDGYRSSMDKIFYETCELSNTFPPIRVLARKKENGKYGDVNDTLELVDLVTGKVVLEVGTNNTDDYYPVFVSAFWPENMASNIKAAAEAKPRPEPEG